MEPRFFRATRLVLGALLLITGILKAVQVFNGSPSDADIVFSQWLPFGIVAELALGVWLVLAGGVFPVLTWLLATAFFCVLGFVSAQSVLMGKPCSCLGVLTSNPWPAMILDLSALACLVVARPDFSKGVPRRLHVSVGALAAGAGMLLALGASVFFTTVTPARNWMYGNLGYSLVPDRFASTVEIDGEGQAEVTFRIANLADKSVKILGFDASCNCLSFSRAPIKFQPGESREIVFRITSKDSRGPTVAHAKLFLDTPSPPIVLSVYAR